MPLPKWATTVTPFSKIIALMILIILPFIGFVLGMKYQQMRTLTQENVGTVSLTPADSTSGEAVPTNTPTGAEIANPAAVYCQEQGGKNEIITAPDGSQSGKCVFSDGRECDDWQFFRTKVCK